MFDFWIYQLYGGRVPLLTKLPSGGANFSYYVSLENALRRLRPGQGNLSSWGTLSTRPRHPSRGLSFCHVNGFVPARDYHPRESFHRYDLPVEVNIII